MSNTYSWQITELNVSPTYAGQNDVVMSVNWNFITSNGTIQTRQLGNTVTPYLSGTAFIPFNTLTQTNIVSWITENIGVSGVTALQTAGDAQLSAMSNAPALSLLPPWNNA